MQTAGSGEDNGPIAGGPLEGIRVLELGSLIAGPFGGRILADFGAEVIKVESPQNPDPMRNWGQSKYRGRPLWWSVQSRNKKCITLNLNTAKGQALFKRLVVDVDLIIENFRPGVMERWGLGWDHLALANPRLIMIRVSGFGQSGPYRGRAGFGSVGEGMGGLRYLTGFTDRPPVRVGISLGDALAALWATIGGLAALYHREQTGLGQVVDCAITEAVFAMMESAVPEFARTGHVRERTGNILPGIAPSNTYPTRDGKFLIIGANQDRVFARLTEVMEQPELAQDPRFCDHAARAQHQHELDERIGEWTRQHDMMALAERLNGHGVPSGPIYSIADIMADPQFRARHMIETIEDPELGALEMPAVVPKLSRTPGRIKWPGPSRLGAQNVEIYQNRLGLSDHEMSELRRDGVI